MSILSFLILFADFFAFSQQTGMQNEADSLHGLILKPAVLGVERPADMFQRNCVDCHTAVIMYYTRYSQLWDTTFKSRDKFIHTWIRPEWSDTSGNIQLFAKGINVFNDTTAVKNAMIEVSLKKDAGWVPVPTQILLTDDSGQATLQINDEIRDMNKGRYEILVKLVDEIVYPNGKYRFRMNWNRPVVLTTEPDRITQSQSEGKKITAHSELLLFMVIIVITAAIVLFYFLYSRFMS